LKSNEVTIVREEKILTVEKQQPNLPLVMSGRNKFDLDKTQPYK